MSSVPVEAVEPSVAALTDIGNGDDGKKDLSAGAPTTDVDLVEAGSTATKQSDVAREEKTEKEVAKKGEAENGNSTRERKHQHSKKYDNGFRRKNNSKYDPKVLEITSDHAEIIKQVEFYFGDSNLPTDDHMWMLTDGSANKPVPIGELLMFGRMKRFLPASEIIAALRKSKFLVVIGEEGKEEIKRKDAYDPNASRKIHLENAIYAKGFGEEEPSSQFDIEAFFAPFGTTNAVRLRRDKDDKTFKGSVFVEFADKETQEKFLSLEPKPLWKGKDELQFMSKLAYMEGKNQDIRDGKMAPGPSRTIERGRGRAGRGNFRGDSRGGHRGRGSDKQRTHGGNRDRDPNDWKKRREDDQASGFRNNKNRNDREGRGGNRGGRRGGRDGPITNGRNEDVDKERKDDKAEDKEIHSSTDANTEEKRNSPVQQEKKRAREDDGEGDQAPAKKVDTKQDGAITEAS